MTRKQPTPSTVKQLFALSGNICANPECANLLTKAETVLGEICHIEAAEPDGPRYNNQSNDEYRRSFENLMLLCATCHTIIDRNAGLYPVELLRTWKAEHEGKFKDSQFKISDMMADKAIEGFMKQSNKNTGAGVQINNQNETQIIGSQIGIQNNTFIGDETQKIEIPGARKAIQRFKAIIDQHKSQASPPSTWVIDYQNELVERIPRDVYLVETKFLRFRKENGRIKSDVKSYEIMNGVELKEEDDETQKLLRDFLAKNDPRKKDVLKKNLHRKGQQHPAIITCDGFLVNGNRRKMALEELYSELDQAPSFEKMRVVILPENVLELDIRKIENRYQLQDEGKSEYQGINRALTIQDNIEIGYDLRAQLRDDPQHADKDKKAMDIEVKKCTAEFLHPLYCAQRYIQYFEKSDTYNSISESAGDREGRWEAFKDYSKFYYGVLHDSAQREKAGILETDIGKIEDFVFKLIRQKDLKGLSKLHMFLRPSNLKKYLAVPSAKKLLFDIVDEVPSDIPVQDKYERNGEKLPESEIDKKWAKRNQEVIIDKLLKAKKDVESQNQKYKPIEILNEVMKLLNHRDLQAKSIDLTHVHEALSLTKKISKRARVLLTELNHTKSKKE